MMLKTVAEVAAYAKEKRVRVGIENMEDRPYEIVHTIEELNRFAPIGEGNPYFGVTIDFGHYATLGVGLPELAKLRLPIHDVHLSQGQNKKVHRPLTLENGIVDVEGAFRLLKEYGYEDSVILEVIEGQKESRKIMDDILASIE